jgi:bacterial leucyl aminopeptidase
VSGLLFRNIPSREASSFIVTKQPGAVMSHLTMAEFMNGYSIAADPLVPVDAPARKIEVVFFDIGDTLGTPRFLPCGQPLSLAIFPYVRSTLARLREDGLRLGVISNTGPIAGQAVRDMLDAAGLTDAFDPGLILLSCDVGMTKQSPAIFGRAAEITKLDPQACLYVGEDAQERANAAASGMAVCPHPLLARDVARGDTLSFAVVTAGDRPAAHWHPLLNQVGALPLHVSGADREAVYVVLSASAIRPLTDARLDVRRLGPENLPARADLYLLRDDAAPGGHMEPQEQSQQLLTNPDTADWLLATAADGRLLAVPAGQSIERVNLALAGHGDTLKLRPDASLLDLNRREGAIRLPESFAATRQPPVLDDVECRTLRDNVSADAVRGLVARYCWAARLGERHNPAAATGGPGLKRKPGNERAAVAAALELDALPGMSAVLHAFDHEGERLHNVEANLPGGRNEWVLITAHLDAVTPSDGSPAAAHGGSSAGDDGASGVAGVIAAARAIAELARVRPPTRGIRFVLFNGLEHGRVGSRAYAREQAARGVAISAVLELGAIGGDLLPAQNLTIDVGSAGLPAVNLRRLQLAALFTHAAASVSPDLPAARVCPTAGGKQETGASRGNRSAFQERGYTACVATTDARTTRAGARGGRADYHVRRDAVVDEFYAADIARAVAATAWLTAR